MTFEPDSGMTSGGGTSKPENWYDTAQICTNGHVITTQLIFSPDHNMKYCDRCGVPTITNCQNCNAIIRGFYHTKTSGCEMPRLPSFCHNCGLPYPWTEIKLRAARELTDLLEDLSLEERDILKKTFDDIIRDTPQTAVAATKFKRLAAKVGKVAGEQLRQLIVDIASETAKKIILQGG